MPYDIASLQRLRCYQLPKSFSEADLFLRRLRETVHLMAVYHTNFPEEFPCDWMRDQQKLLPEDENTYSEAELNCLRLIEERLFPFALEHLHLSTQNPAEPLIIAPMLPALVFAGVQSTYYVWALPTASCDPQAPLCHAPLPNVYPDGHICFGRNRPPMVSWETLDEAWQLFLRSPFNADMVQGKSQAFPADVRRQLVAVASSEASCYPEDDLRPFVRRNSFSDMKELRTLDDIVEHYLLRKGTQQ